MKPQTESGQATRPDWQNCHGEVNSLVRGLRHRRSAARAKVTALLAILAVVSISGSVYYPDLVSRLNAQVTGSYCDQYLEQMRGFYCDHSRADLDPQLWDHISRCHECRRALSLFNGIAHTKGDGNTKPDPSTQRAKATGRSVSWQFVSEPTLAVH